MKDILWKLLPALLLTSIIGAGRPVSADLALVEKGRAAALIVLPDAAGPQSMEQQAADLLVYFIQRISGARLEIKRERELDAIQVEKGWVEYGLPEGAIMGQENVPGEVAQAELPKTPAAWVLIGPTTITGLLGVNAADLGPGGLRLKTTANALILLGGPERIAGRPGSDPAGLRHAAIELLRRLGCEYLWPGELGLVIPKLQTVAVKPLDYAYTPPIRRREIRWSAVIGSERPESGLKRLGITAEQWQAGYDKVVGSLHPISFYKGRLAANDGLQNEPGVMPGITWTGWHRLGGNMPSFVHAGGGLRDAERHLREHPEWFALQADGTRDQGGDTRFRLCKSNPGLIEHVANDIIQRLKENPNLELISLDSNDGGSNTGWCICENCRALDPPNAPKLTLTTFGERVRPDNPTRKRIPLEHVALTDRMVHYWNAIAERVTKVYPNVLFGVSAYSIFSTPPVRERLHPNIYLRYVPSTTEYVQGWKDAGLKQLYWRPNILLVNRRHGKLRSIVGDLSRNMRYFADGGVVQTDFDSILHNWSTLGLSYYAAARLNWDPYLDPQSIINDFARAGFGAGAPHIISYFQLVEKLSAAGSGAEGDGGNTSFAPKRILELRRLLKAAAAAEKDVTVQQRIAFLRLGLNFTELQERLEDKSARARNKQPVDMDLAARLVDLNCLVMRDITLNHNLAVNAPNLVWATSSFATFTPVKGRTVTPSNPALLQRLGQPGFGWTGREDNLEEMLAAFGLNSK